MTHQETAEALETLLDDVDCGQPQVGDLLVLGRVRRSRRRALMSYAIGCAVVFALVATGGVAVRLSGGQVDAASAPGNLDVAVRGGPAPGGVVTYADVATWDSATRTLVYPFVHGSSCPPDSATANRADDGQVTLTIVIRYPDGVPVCTADAHPAAAVITDLDVAPPVLTVTGLSDTVDTVPVVLLPPTLTCPTGEQSDLTINGEAPRRGMPSAAALVARASTNDRDWILIGSTAFALRPDGTVYEKRDIADGPRGFFFTGGERCSE